MQFEDIIKLPWREALSILEKDSPRPCTWRKISNFLKKTYSQDQIVQVNIFLWKVLDSMDLELDESDEVRDCIDPWWYAMEDVEKFNEARRPYLKEDEKMS